jgi:hypothetical protein
VGDLDAARTGLQAHAALSAAPEEGMRLAWREDWLTEDRVRIYPRILLALYLVLGIGWVVLSKDHVDRSAKPLGYDFITFWAASDLALEGRATDAYDTLKIFAAEKQAVPAGRSIYLWHYPPVFQLYILPLALAPYLLSCALWIFGTLALYALYFRKLLPERHAVWLLLAFPAVFVNVMHGQNGFLTAVLIAGACLNLEKRPVLAGILIGALCYKPHFGILFPLVLLAGRYWIALVAAAISTLAVCAAATLAFGTAGWVAFVHNLPLTRHILEVGFLPWYKMPTLFATARMLGVGIDGAYAVQFVVAAIVAAVTVQVWWRRRGSLELRSALLAVALLMISPYAFDYDLVILALPIGLMAVDGVRNGWMPGMRTVLVAAWFAPLVLPGVAEKVSLQLMPFVLLALFASIRWRIGMATEPRAVFAPA